MSAAACSESAGSDAERAARSRAALDTARAAKPPAGGVDRDNDEPSLTVRGSPVRVVRGGDGVASPAVTNRMLRRALVFSGLPIFLGLALYPVFIYLKVRAPGKSI